MIIYIINTSSTITSKEFYTVVKALRKQVKQFYSAWGMNATLKTKSTKNKDKQDPSLNTADAIIYVGELGDDPDSVDNALGYHSLNHLGIPYGFVFTDIAAQIGEPWSVTLSHEVLELIADPDTNLLVAGPNPTNAKSYALHSYEVCDAVQGDVYDIDGVKVSNFLLPLYFAELPKTTIIDTNFMKLKLDRFGVRPQGYISYYDLSSNSWKNVFGQLAEDRVKTKAKMGNARRAVRKANVVKK